MPRAAPMISAAGTSDWAPALKAEAAVFPVISLSLKIRPMKAQAIPNTTNCVAISGK